MLLVLAIFLLAVHVLLGLNEPGIALIAHPIAIVFFTFVAQGGYVIIAIGILFAVIMAILAALEWSQKWAKWILIGAVFLLLFAAAFILFKPAGVIGLGFFVLFIGLVISYGLASRYATAAYVISTIGSSIRQNLPLPMALESAAGGRTDKRSKILKAIQNWLVQGYPLSESIKFGYPKCPGFAVAMIVAAERIDQLPDALRSIEADIAARADESRKIRPVHPFYPVILIIFVFFMVWALTTFVVPQFATVLEDVVESQAQLPAATRFLMRLTEFLTREVGSLLLVAFAIIVFVIAIISIRIKFRPRRPQNPYLISRIGDFIKWHLPILRWFEKNYSTVRTVELLRLSLNTGCTVNDAISNTLDLDVNNCFKKRLKKWLAKVEVGSNIAVSAKESKLGNTLAWAFDDRVNQGNTLPILETLESFYRSNYSYRVNLARFIMGPCIVIIMGATVGFVVYAFFSPMVVIINHTANLIIP